MITDPQTDTPVSGCVLVVDDVRVHRTIHREILAREFEVITAESGEDALKICSEKMPDLILLDVAMPGMDGFEVCRRIRGFSDVPVIFVTACQTAEEHMQAYDAGGDDIVTKPVNADIILRKVRQALRRNIQKKQLEAEHTNLQSMAMHFLSSAGENGILLNFMRVGTTCRSHEQLAGEILKALGEYGVTSSVMLRHNGRVTAQTLSGPPSDLEYAVLEKLSTMGRIFEFKNRLVVNYEHTTIIVTGMPIDDPEKMGRIRDNVTILTESAEALSDIVTIRQHSVERAEKMQLALGKSTGHIQALQGRHKTLLVDIRWRLHEFVDSVEDTYTYLDTTPEQEMTITTTMNAAVEKIMEKLTASTAADQADFEAVLQVLRGKNDDDDVLLF